jgi:outer membrane protein assembly factor BamE (lipoprotein component of BamABCDE complex)
MKTTTSLAALALILALPACAPLVRWTPTTGTPLAEVTARLGQPNAIYPEPGGGQVLEYRGQPMGQFQHMARIDANGRLLSYEQVLTTENFAQVRIGYWNKDDILRHFGRPAEVSRERVNDDEVWSYRYKEKGVWDSLMNITFTKRGVVRQMAVTADPILDESKQGM